MGSSLLAAPFPQEEPIGTPDDRSVSGVEISEPNASTECHANVDTWMGTATDRTYDFPHFASTMRINIRVNDQSCRWKIDRDGTPTWIQLVTRGRRGASGYIIGSGSVDINVRENTGLSRSGRFRIQLPAAASFRVPVDISQRSVRDNCINDLAGTNGTVSSSREPGFVVIAGYKTRPPASQILYYLHDSSGCRLDPIARNFDGGLNGTTIQIIPPPRIGVQPTDLLIRQPGNPPNTPITTPGAALLSASRPSEPLNTVAVLYLPQLAELPSDLRITHQTFSTYFLAFGDGGGPSEISGHVTRATSNPSRPCAFTRDLYRVVGLTQGAPWLSISSDSGCTSSPDSGKLILSVRPRTGGSWEAAAIYTAWGSVIFVVRQ